MKKCVLGNGYIGSAFKNAGYDCLDRSQLNVSNIGDWSMRYVLETSLNEYDVIVNCIAITDTKWTEYPENFAQVYKTNSNFVANLSAYCASKNKKLVHISTGDLYGNTQKTQEDSLSLDANTNYRLSKLVAERLCSPNDLILRIRLPFDARNHPKNLIVKCLKYNKFYAHKNCYSYVDDIISATNILVDKNQCGIFNIVQPQSSLLLNLVKLITKDEKIHNLNENVFCSDISYEWDHVHVHNAMATDKISQFFEPQSLNEAWVKSYDTLMLTMRNNVVM